MAWLDVKGNSVVKMSKSKLHQLGKGQNRHVENKELTWFITKSVAVISLKLLFETEIVFERVTADIFYT